MTHALLENDGAHCAYTRRGFDTSDVKLCSTAPDKARFNGIRRKAESGGGELQAMGVRFLPRTDGWGVVGDNRPPADSLRLPGGYRAELA